MTRNRTVIGDWGSPPPHGVWRAWRGALGNWAASGWLNLLFGAARWTPWLVRGIAPLGVAGAWVLSPALRRNTLSNARRLLGADATATDRRRLALRVVRSFYDAVCDIGRSRTMSLDDLLSEVEAVDGHEHYLAARDLGRGAVVLTAHLGSFEVGVAALRQHESAIHIVFHTDRLASFERIRSELHERLGLVEARIDQGWGVWVDLRDALERDEVVLMQGDRVMPNQRGVAVQLLGGHTLLPLGPFKLAKLTGSPILPVFAVRQPSGKVRLVVEPHIDAQAIGDSPDDEAPAAMQAFAAVLERQLRAHPEQWLSLHRAFIEDQSPEATTG